MDKVYWVLLLNSGMKIKNLMDIYKKLVYIIFLFNPFIQFIYLLNFIGTFDDGSFIIVCINKEQAIAWKNTECFQIDMHLKECMEI